MYPQATLLSFETFSSTYFLVLVPVTVLTGKSTYRIG